MQLTEVTGNPRHDRLIALISEFGYMSIEDIAHRLEVSPQTIRRDIRKLSEQNLISRHHGGAGRVSPITNTAFEEREILQTLEKEIIAQTLVESIPDHSTLFITIGTTVEQIARALLTRKHLQIITNSLRVAHILYKNKDLNVMVPGGIIRSHNSGIIGTNTIAFVEGFRADYLITSIGAIEPDGTLLEFDVGETAVVKAMIKNSRHIFLAADHTKFTAKAAVELGHTRQISALFTDQPPPVELNHLLAQQQVDIHIANTVPVGMNVG
jgi:DeoR/GlpR family transcriptional regulator of sugar metabolism